MANLSQKEWATAVHNEINELHRKLEVAEKSVAGSHYQPDMEIIHAHVADVESQRDALAAALIIPKAVAETFACMKPPESVMVNNVMYWRAKGMLENWLPQCKAALAGIPAAPMEVSNDRG